MAKTNLVNRQGEELQEAIKSLLKDLQPDAKIGLYCAIKPLSPPPYPAHFEEYEQEIGPTAWLADLPVTVAHACAALVGARGPVKIFNHPAMGYTQAVEQARLDLQSGLIEQAVICGHDLESARAELLP